MQLDADDNDDGEPFFKPPPVPTAPIPKSGDVAGKGVLEAEQPPQQQQESTPSGEGGVEEIGRTAEGGAEGETSQKTAAVVTAESEE